MGEMDHEIVLLRRQFVTHDVQRFTFTRPERFVFEPGQGVELAVDTPEWRDERRPFTPTSLPGDGVVEFTIKRYSDHHGVTEHLHGLPSGARLRMSEPFGTIRYRGPGVFLAGGAGMTPFLSILRHLAGEGGEGIGASALFFSNKTRADVFCERELRHALGERCVLLTTREATPGYLHRRIDRELLAERVRDFGQRFYVCGPDPFVADLKRELAELGAASDTLVFEE
jgi:ferredoxin-NADP reductase